MSNEQIGSQHHAIRFKSTNGLSDKGFDQLLGIIRKMLLEKNELPEKTYLAKQMICPIGLEVEKIYACSNDCILYRGKNTKTWTSAPSVKLHGTRKGHQMRVPRPEEVP